MPKSFNLFEQHLLDLRRVSPNAGEVFVCPICFKVVPKEELDNSVDLGHVWPQFLRDSIGSDAAKHQQVLLCKACNSAAGSHGDNEMQDHYKYRQGLLPHKFTILPPTLAGESIDLKLYLTPDEVEDGSPQTAQFKINVPRKEWLNNPRWQRFRELQENREPFNAIVDMLPIDADLARVGWLTSAYLYAFYTFGYRYVFHSTLDYVRDCIRESFLGTVSADVAFESTKDTTTFIDGNSVVQEPYIMYQIEIEGSDVPPHLKVSFLDYHVRLPIPLKVILVTKQEELDQGQVLLMNATGHKPHDGSCQWDILLARPDYEVIGATLNSIYSPPADPSVVHEE